MTKLNLINCCSQKNLGFFVPIFLNLFLNKFVYDRYCKIRAIICPCWVTLFLNVRYINRVVSDARAPHSIRVKKHRVIGRFAWLLNLVCSEYKSFDKISSRANIVMV